MDTLAVQLYISHYLGMFRTFSCESAPMARKRNVRRQAHIKNYAPVGSFVDPPGRFFPIIRILLLRSHITHEVRLSEVSMEQIMSTFAVYCVAVTQKIYCGFVGWKNMIAQQSPSSTR